jgi:ABC-2 type transport system ATP-binding protein
VGSGRRDTAAAETERVLEVVGLSDRSGDVVGTFSKGMQQRLGLAVALIGQPALVVLDEPTSALDPVGRADVRSIIRNLRDAGTTVFLNSHLLTEVERVCDRVAIVDRGRVLASGALDALLGTPTVRVRVTDLPSTALTDLAVFGRPVPSDDGWLTIDGLADERVPDLVAAIVDGGGRVHAVDQGRTTLEDRYFELIRGSDVAGRPRGVERTEAGPGSGRDADRSA